MRFWRVAGQIADEVLEGSGTHSKQSSGGFRYKHVPRSSKLLGITHGFIFSRFIQQQILCRCFMQLRDTIFLTS